MDFDSTEELNANFVKNILLTPMINGTKDGLIIKNNIFVDTTFSFSVQATTWGNVSAR